MSTPVLQIKYLKIHICFQIFHIYHFTLSHQHKTPTVWDRMLPWYGLIVLHVCLFILVLLALPKAKLPHLPTPSLSLSQVWHARVARCIPVGCSISMWCWVLTGHHCLQFSAAELRYHLFAHHCDTPSIFPPPVLPTSPSTQWIYNRGEDHVDTKTVGFFLHSRII